MMKIKRSYCFDDVLLVPQRSDITMDDIRAQLGVNQETDTATVGDAIDMGYSFVKHVDVI